MIGSLCLSSKGETTERLTVMRLVCLSDTHNQHKDLGELPKGDVLIHAGDWTGTGTKRQVIDFIDWFASQPHPHKILIAGNHELTLDKPHYQKEWWRFHNTKADEGEIKDYVLNHPAIHYLEDSELVIEGRKFYGSPYSPAFGGWGFNIERGLPIRAIWSNIPDDTDVLITHGPPAGFGDELYFGERVGCGDLLKEVVHRVNPVVHIFGHIHEGYGKYESENTVFLNASICDEKYTRTNAPIVFDLK